MPLSRRTLIAAGAALGATSGLARAQTPSLPGETFPLWPARPPGSERVTATQAEIMRSPTGPADDTAFTHVTSPTLSWTRPAKPNGAALIFIPGGGYVRVAIGRGGRAIADHFAARGFHVFTLLYRLPADGWAAGPDASLQDAQRALRLVRARAASAGFDPARIGVLGGSAGGHLAARLASVETATYQPVDAADAQPLGVKVAGLLYPVNLMDGPHVHGGSLKELLGTDATPQRRAAFAGDAAFSPRTPPTFLAHALDDRSVVPENSLAMLAKLRRGKVPCELHLFEKGGHGFGLRLPDGSHSPWPDLFLAFATRHGLT